MAEIAPRKIGCARSSKPIIISNRSASAERRGAASLIPLAHPDQNCAKRGPVMSTLQAPGAARVRSLRKLGSLPGRGDTLRVTKGGGDLLPKRTGIAGSRTKPAGRDLPGPAVSIDLQRPILIWNHEIFSKHPAPFAPHGLSAKLADESAPHCVDRKRVSVASEITEQQ